MEKTITLDIENRLPSLPETVCQKLSLSGTGPVSDACPDAVVIGGGLFPLGDYPCAVGRALPVEAGPADNLTVWSSLKFARSGDVLLVSTEACLDSSVFGDLLVGFANNAGIAAMITDGCIRDFNGIKETGLPVYAAGTSPRAPKKDGPGVIGRSVTLCGVEIQRDMIVVCDRDGIVAFKEEHLESTLEKLEAVGAKESKAAQEIAEKRTLPTWIESLVETIHFTD